jgi:hypothetical protein
VSIGARQYQAASTAAFKLSEFYKSDKSIMDILFGKVRAYEGAAQVESGIKQAIVIMNNVQITKPVVNKEKTSTVQSCGMRVGVTLFNCLKAFDYIHPNIGPTLLHTNFSIPSAIEALVERSSLISDLQMEEEGINLAIVKSKPTREEANLQYYEDYQKNKKLLEHRLRNADSIRQQQRCKLDLELLEGEYVEECTIWLIKEIAVYENNVRESASTKLAYNQRVVDKIQINKFRRY